MPSTDDVERPPEAVEVASQYLRRERPLSGLVVLLAVSIFLGTYLVYSLLPAVVVAAVLIVAARFPILRPSGTIRLRTNNGLDTVVEEFTGPTPPVLALQWGVADTVSTDGETSNYSISYLFGLRTVDVAVRTTSETTSGGGRLVESEVSVNDHPWATYSSKIGRADGHTTIDVEYTSNRRFGLRRLPQQLVAKRYRDDVLTAQGYTIVERDANLGL